jgi:hypothetical protein
MTNFDYSFDIKNNAMHPTTKVDIRLCRWKMTSIMGFFPVRDNAQILHSVYEVNKDKDSIQLVIDELEQSKDKYEKIFDDNIEKKRIANETYLRNVQQERDRLSCVERMINDINGKSIKK